MKNIKPIYITLFLISASIICFEIVSTRISSLIFAYNYAFIIFSLAILGLGMGGIFSHYRISSDDSATITSVTVKTINLLGVSLVFFIAAIIFFSISNPFIYFLLLIIPFFLAGIAYSQIFKLYAAKSFPLYASDLTGAAVGSAVSIFILGFLGAPNSVLILTVIVFGTVLIFTPGRIKKAKLIPFSSILILIAVKAISYMDKDNKNKLIPYIEKYKKGLEQLDKQNPYGVPIENRGWGSDGMIVNWVITNYYLTKAFPQIIGPEYTYKALNYIYGCHPYSNISFVASVGTHSEKRTYTNNRTDFYFIAGGVVAGLLMLQPDFLENKEDWPFLWGENECVIGMGAEYIFLANAANDLLGRNVK